MRALTAAIVTAGGLIGLGLTALGLGTRYQNVGTADPAHLVFVRLKDLDTAILLILVTLIVVTLVGVGLLFLGLAYHHERRHHERHHRGGASETLGSRVGV
jgi:hypothetical protein